MRNAGRISGLSFLGGDLLLGIQYAIPAAGFIAADAFLAASDFQNRKLEDILPRLPIGDASRTLIAKVAPHGLCAAGVASLLSTTALGYLVRIGLIRKKQNVSSCLHHVLPNIKLGFSPFILKLLVYNCT